MKHRLCSSALLLLAAACDRYPRTNPFDPKSSKFVPPVDASARDASQGRAEFTLALVLSDYFGATARNNNDGIAQPGERLAIEVRVTNTGTADFLGGHMSMSGATGCLKNYPSPIHVVEVAPIPVGENTQVGHDVFGGDVSDLCKFGDMITLKFSLETRENGMPTSSEELSASFPLVKTGANIRYVSHAVQFQNRSNGDSIFDMGEQANVTVSATNVGTATVPSLTATVSTLASCIKLAGKLQFAEGIEMGATKQSGPGNGPYFTATALSDCGPTPPKIQIVFDDGLDTWKDSFDL